MSVVNIASRNLSDAGSDHLAELAVSLSGRLTRVLADGMPAALAESLAEIAAAICVDGCRLYEFGDAGTLVRVHEPAVPANTSDRPRQAAEPEDWLVQRLGSGETVSISRPEDLPREAILSRQQVRQVARARSSARRRSQGARWSARWSSTAARCRAVGRRRWSNGCNC